MNPWRSIGIGLLLVIPLLDLLLAWSYSIGAPYELVRSARYVRDGLIVVLAARALLIASVPGAIRVGILVYGLLIGLYCLPSLAAGTSVGLLVSSSAVLAIPVLLFLAGFASHRCLEDVQRSVRIVFALAVASSLFGVWDLRNTAFWEFGVEFGRYREEVKGILTGFHYQHDLNWSFFRGMSGDRRAGGLLADPLAQGAFLASALVLWLGLQRVRLGILGWVGILIVLLGIYESGTRAAMLSLIIALGVYAFAYREEFAGTSRAVLLLVAIVLGGALFVGQLLVRTLSLAEGSAYIHYLAFAANFRQLADSLLGHGVGAAGRAAVWGYEIVGAGEGAFFSLVFQVGILGSLAFAAFAVSVCRLLLRRGGGVSLEEGSLCTAGGAALLGFFSTIFFNDTLFTVSGTAGLWLVVGGMVRVRAMQDPSGVTTSRLPRVRFV